MKAKLQRIISLLLTFFLCVSLVTISAPVASAVSPAVVSAAGTVAKSLASGAFSELGSKIVDFVFDDQESSGTEDSLLDYWVGSALPSEKWLVVDLDYLRQLAYNISNAGISCNLSYIPSCNAYYIVCTNGFVSDGQGGGRFSAALDGRVFATAAGQVPVAFSDEELSDEETAPTMFDQWIFADDAAKSNKVVVVTYQTLSDMVSEINATGTYAFIHTRTIYGTKYYCIVGEDWLYMYCNAQGYPYVASIESTVTDVKYDYIVNENGDTIDNSQVIDMTNGTFNFIDESGKLESYINNLVYDFSTKTYSADTYNITYDTTNNSYNVSNYTYNVQYHIEYTSVTYIGQTAEYDKQYEYYYELPDGRSSADLTAADLEQISLVFSDVVNYARSSDDASMRALYHFDGNTEDSSYWSYCSSFDWSSGASLTYLDEGTFNGSLYLDETEHEFTITLPGFADASNDWTFQFRYYQSYTATPKLDSYIMVGSDILLQMNGSKFFDGTGMALAQTSIGNWMEVCLMSQSGTLYYFLNGVHIGSVVDDYHNNTITFHFGSSQQTYKKLDELRFTRGAIYSASENYTPSSVPYDTNLALILPDGRIPVADEVLKISSSNSNLLSSIVDICSSDATRANFFSLQSSASSSLFFSSEHSSLNGSIDGFSFTPLVSSSRVEHYLNGQAFYLPGGAFFLPTCLSDWAYHSSGWHSHSFLTHGQTYCFSVVLSDGTYGSYVFTMNKRSSSSSVEYYYPVGSVLHGNSSFDFYYSEQSYFVSTPAGMDCYCGIGVVPVDSRTLDIVYVELVEGSSPQFTLEWDQAFYDPEQLQDSPVLAVRTNRTITGYQIGGVRPSYPSKGLVYAMVENSRIRSLQQYTGYAWEEVDGRIWTGSRWIPYSSFDVFTLKDCLDVVGSSGSDYTYIYTESGFWDWWQRAWIDFRSWLSGAITGSSGSGSSLAPGSVKDSVSDALSSLVEGVFGVITEALKSLIGAAGDLLSGIFSFFSDTVLGGISGFFSSITDGSLFEGFQQTDENGNVTTGLPDGIASVFAFFSGLFMVMPGELRMIMLFGIGLFLLLAVFKVIKS